MAESPNPQLSGLYDMEPEARKHVLVVEAGPAVDERLDTLSAARLSSDVFGTLGPTPLPG